MPHRAQRHRKVAGQAADIGALAAVHLENGAIGVERFDQVQPVDDDLPRRRFDRRAGPRQPVGALAVHPDGGEGRRRLRDLADEGGQGAVDFGCGGPPAAGRDDRALAVVGVPRLAPADGKAVGFPPVHHEGDGLGRLAQGDRENAGGQRVEGSGMAGLLRVEGAPDDAHGARRADAGRLVEIDPAVNRPPAPPTGHRRPFRPRGRGRAPPGGPATGRRRRWRRRRTDRRERRSAA